MKVRLADASGNVEKPVERADAVATPDGRENPSCSRSKFVSTLLESPMRAGLRPAINPKSLIPDVVVVVGGGYDTYLLPVVLLFVVVVVGGGGQQEGVLSI